MKSTPLANVGRESGASRVTCLSLFAAILYIFVLHALSGCLFRYCILLECQLSWFWEKVYLCVFLFKSVDL